MLNLDSKIYYLLRKTILRGEGMAMIFISLSTFYNNIVIIERCYISIFYVPKNPFKSIMLSYYNNTVNLSIIKFKIKNII